MHIPHLVITLGAITAATAAVLRALTRVEVATWRVAATEHEILTAVQERSDVAQLN